MKEVLLTSSVLIGTLTILRYLFRRKVSRRMQYSLWLLVLVRLALPFPLPAAGFSVMTGAERLTGHITAVRADAPAAHTPAVSPSHTGSPAPARNDTQSSPSASQTGSVPAFRTAPTLPDLLPILWLTGTTLMLGWFLAANLRFSRRLRQNRTPFDAPACPLPVYITDGAVSPCLYGLFRPVICLTPKAAGEPEPRLRHILTHELCHYRHGDHIWSALRCLTLAVYWFDPLVWLAAVLSRADAEQACDEAAIRVLGEEQRLPYGKTLIDMIAVRSGSTGLFCTATTMVTGKRGLKKRLERIVQRQKPLVWAIAVTLTLAAILAGCTFTGAKNPAADPDSSLTATPEDHYIEYTETADETLNEFDGRYDLYTYRYNVPVSREVKVWAEVWETGELTSAQMLAGLTLTGEPGELDICLTETKPEAADWRDLNFLVRNQGESVYSTFCIPAGSEYSARATAWLGSGNENRYNLTEKTPIILLNLTWHRANIAQPSYNCEYLMEDPTALRQCECVVLVRCAFADAAGQNAPFPSVSTAEDSTITESSYTVALVKDGKEIPLTGLDPALPEDVVFDGLVKSAAWPAVEITDRPYVFHIRRTLATEDGPEVSDHYACRLDDGKAVIQGGGYYSMLSEDLMVRLEKAAGIEPAQIYNLDAALTKAILEQSAGPGEYQTETHEVLATETDDRSDGSVVTVYCMVLNLSFDSDGETLTENGGSSGPAAISFFENLDGAYTLSEYWTPEDGAYYAPSIRKKFPADIAEVALNTPTGISETQRCYARAIAWFGLDLTDEISRRIDTLCVTPNWETPSPYVEPGYLDFRQLLFYGDETLRYVFREYLKGGQTGERDHVLHRLMEELLGGENISAAAENGQDYFDHWKALVLRLYEQNDLDYFRNHAPRSYLLLDELGLTRPLVADAPALN